MPLDYSIIQYGTYFFYNDEGKPEGTMYDNMKILAEYLDFIPIIHLGSFTESVEMVEQGDARIGSPAAASFE